MAFSCDLACSTRQAEISRERMVATSFSRFGIFPDAVAGGYYVPARKQKTTANSDSSDSKAIKVTFPPFIIDDDSVSEDLTTRSVQFYTGLVERLSKLETRKKVYTKRAIINHLLDVALRHYGF